MPNYSFNLLTITGSKNEIKRFTESLKQNNLDLELGLDFEVFLPIPKGLKDENDWLRKSWGTNWNAEEQKVEVKSETELIIRFRCGWNPPFNLFYVLINQFPELEFNLKFWLDYVGTAGEYIYSFSNRVGEVDYDFSEAEEPYLAFVEEYFNSKIRYELAFND